jgi:hypothetical protein
MSRDSKREQRYENALVNIPITQTHEQIRETMSNYEKDAIRLASLELYLDDVLDSIGNRTKTREENKYIDRIMNEIIALRRNIERRHLIYDAQGNYIEDSDSEGSIDFGRGISYKKKYDKMSYVRSFKK